MVFFSRITLEGKLGTAYEPYIFAALNSAKVMIVVGTKPEYVNAVWVKNEWSRFLSLIESGQKKSLIPCYKNIDAYDMPAEFKRLQAQDMGKVGAIQDLVRGIGKILGNSNITQSTVIQTSATTGALTVRGNISLSDGDFEKAYEYFERSLDDNPADAKAYLGKVLSKLHLKDLVELRNCINLIDLDRIPDFKHALQFSVGQDKAELESIYEELERKTQIRYLIQVIKKRAKIKEKEEYLEAKEKERQRELEELRKKKVQQDAYDEAVLKINLQIKTEVDELTNDIKASAEAKKAPIIEQMNQKMKEIQAVRSQLDEQRRELERQRSSLGIFQMKQKSAITVQVDEINKQLRAFPSDADIRTEYSAKINQIDDILNKEIKDLDNRVRAKYTMPSLEDFAVE